MFTPEQTRKVNRIKELQVILEGLITQKKSLPRKHLLHDRYTITISSLLDAIERLSDKIGIIKTEENTEE